MESSKVSIPVFRYPAAEGQAPHSAEITFTPKHYGINVAAPGLMQMETDLDNKLSRDRLIGHVVVDSDSWEFSHDDGTVRLSIRGRAETLSARHAVESAFRGEYGLSWISVVDAEH